MDYRERMFYQGMIKRHHQRIDDAEAALAKGVTYEQAEMYVYIIKERYKAIERLEGYLNQVPRKSFWQRLKEVF